MALHGHGAVCTRHCVRVTLVLGGAYTGNFSYSRYLVHTSILVSAQIPYWNIEICWYQII